MKRRDGDDATLQDSVIPTAPSNDPSTPRPSDTLTGYALGAVIGRGGMGEVVQARDLQIGRDVAIKRMRGAATDDEAVARFLREAKIQARLDHPAIVPVHELGRDAHGEPYFTMKRLTGVTLAELIERGTETRQRLLRAFVDVVQAIELAHAKRIIHRDLKPANIMLGDYGEVYVLDWGLARELEDIRRTGPIRTTSTPVSGVTAVGSLLGTPGYMAPEQIEDASSVGEAADVYALGAVLFEILTGEPLHPRDHALTTTIEGIETSPRRRYPNREVPPELDQWCTAAVSSDPDRRPSARALADGVQAYLDGDRDLAMRREAAREAFERAKTALAEHREDDAMRDAGRAIALDRTSEATTIVSRLMLEPPATPPPELLAEFDRADHETTVKHARHATLMSLMILPLLAIAVWNGAKSLPLLGSIAAASIVLSVSARLLSRNPARAERELYAYAVLIAALVAMIGRICSPLVIAPPATCLMIASMATYPTFTRKPTLMIAGLIAGWVVPVLLELFDVVRPTWEFVNGQLAIHSYAIDLDGAPATVFVLTSTVAIFVAVGLLVTMNARISYAAQRELLTQRWRMRVFTPT